MTNDVRDDAELLPVTEPAGDSAVPTPETLAGSRTVLVIDDEVDTREAVSEALEDAGYRVVLAANGKEGLDLLAALTRPCGVVLDLTMPVMDGVELYRIMKATPGLEDIPVVISTADPARVPKGVTLMKKPVSLERLLTAVAALFRTTQPSS